MEKILHRQEKYFWIDLLSLSGCISICLRDMVGGPIRFYVAYWDQTIWFIPDFIVALALFVSIFSGSSKNKNIAVLLISSLIFYGINGFRLTHSYTALFSAIKMVCPMYLAILIGDKFIKAWSNWLFAFIVLLISSVGIIYDYIYTAPWVAYSYDSFGVDRTAARLWWDSGGRRIGGFCVDSTTSAFFVLTATIFLASKSSKISKIILYAFSIEMIQITTSKTAMTVCIVIAVYDAVCNLNLYKDKRNAKLLCYISAITAIIIPIASISFASLGLLDGFDVNYYSFVVRAKDSWVLPFSKLVYDFPMSAITGFGLGPTGYPVDFTNLVGFKDIMNSVDNFPLFLFLTFGPVAFGIMGYSLRKIIRRSNNTINIVLLSVVMIYGITVQGAGNALFMMIFGSLVGYSFNLVPPTVVSRKSTASEMSHSLKHAQLI